MPEQLQLQFIYRNKYNACAQGIKLMPPRRSTQTIRQLSTHPFILVFILLYTNLAAIHLYLSLKYVTSGICFVFNQKVRTQDVDNFPEGI